MWQRVWSPTLQAAFPSTEALKYRIIEAKKVWQRVWPPTLQAAFPRTGALKFRILEAEKVWQGVWPPTLMFRGLAKLLRVISGYIRPYIFVISGYNHL